MGDRANVKIEASAYKGGPAAPLYLYTHWGGSELPRTLQAALQRRQRWNDDSYLARIIFCTMLDGDTGETGYGIATQMPDNDYPILSVHVPSQTVRIVKEEAQDVIIKSWTFEEYCALDFSKHTWSVLEPSEG